MSRRRRAKKKGMSPTLAVVMLLASTAYVVFVLGNPFGGGGVGDAGSFAALPADGMPEPQEAATEIVWRDLLAEFGSFDEQEGVRSAFSLLPELDFVAAAPGGETALRVGMRWRGEDPPLVRLGVIMVSERSRRAVFDGMVVGVGDSVANGTVTAIEPGSLQLLWQERQLTYDLDGTAPREFRRELARRERERLEAEKSGERAANAAGQEETR